MLSTYQGRNRLTRIQPSSSGFVLFYCPQKAGPHSTFNLSLPPCVSPSVCSVLGIKSKNTQWNLSMMMDETASLTLKIFTYVQKILHSCNPLLCIYLLFMWSEQKA